MKADRLDEYRGLVRRRADLLKFIRAEAPPCVSVSIPGSFEIEAGRYWDEATAGVFVSDATTVKTIFEAAKTAAKTELQRIEAELSEAGIETAPA